MALPSASKTGGMAVDPVLTNATDVAGHISLTLNNSEASTAVVTFGYTYATAPIVILTATNPATATQIIYWWVTSTQTTFTINISATMTTGDYSWNYHVFETQSANATGSFAITGTSGITTVTHSNGTDVAGIINLTPSSAGAAVATKTYGYSCNYPQIVFTAGNEIAATHILSAYTVPGTGTTTTHTFNLAAGSAVLHTYHYHIFDTEVRTSIAATSVTGTNWTTANNRRLNFTDTAGTITLNPGAGTAAGSATFTFTYAYATAPIIVLSPIDDTSNGKMNLIHVTSTQTTFTITAAAGFKVSTAHTFCYHIIETQA